MSEEEESKQSERNGQQWRVAGGTEQSWCRAVPLGTGTTVLSLLLSKPPLLHHALHKLQAKFPILNSKLTFNPSTSTYSYVLPPSPHLHIHSLDQSSTAQILKNYAHISSIPSFHCILEHELDTNTWGTGGLEQDVFFASLYCLGDGNYVLALRLHTSVCDRTSAGTILRELVGILVKDATKEEEGEMGVVGEVGLAVEDCIPSGKANKPFWARGADILGYTFNGLRFSNLEFVDPVSQRSTKVIRFQLSSEETDGVLSVSG